MVREKASSIAAEDTARLPILWRGTREAMSSMGRATEAASALQGAKESAW